MEVSYTQIMIVAENVCSNCDRPRISARFGDAHDYCNSYCELKKLIERIEKDGKN